MLCLQFCLLALIAWRMVDPLGGGGSPDSDVASGIASLKKTLEERSAIQAAQERVRIRSEVLDQVVADRGAGPGVVERLQKATERAERLDADVAARDAQVRELTTSVSELGTRLSSMEARARNEAERLQRRIDELAASLDKKTIELNASERQVAALEAKLKPADDAKADGEQTSVLWWVGGGIAAAVIVVGGVWLGGKLWLERGESLSQPDPLTTQSVPATSPPEPLTPDS
jgi:hypothetical protein